MKKTISIIVGALLLSISAKNVFASEGQAILSSSKVGGPKCLATSVYIDSSYDVLLTCRDLVTPYSAEVTRYNLWYYNIAQKKWSTFGRVNQGKLSAKTNFRFEDLKLTAESTSSPHEPSEMVVAIGKIAPFEFDKGSPAVMITSSPTPTPKYTVTPTVISGTTNRIGDFVRTVAKLLVIGFVILLIGVIVMTVITRRKEI